MPADTAWQSLLTPLAHNSNKGNSWGHLRVAGTQHHHRDGDACFLRREAGARTLRNEVVTSVREGQSWVAGARSGSDRSTFHVDAGTLTVAFDCS